MMYVLSIPSPPLLWVVYSIRASTYEQWAEWVEQNSTLHQSTQICPAHKLSEWFLHSLGTVFKQSQQFILCFFHSNPVWASHQTIGISLVFLHTWSQPSEAGNLPTVIMQPESDTHHGLMCYFCHHNNHHACLDKHYPGTMYFIYPKSSVNFLKRGRATNTPCNYSRPTIVIMNSDIIKYCYFSEPI